MSEDVRKCVQYPFPVQLVDREQELSMHVPISNGHPPSLRAMCCVHADTDAASVA